MYKSPIEITKTISEQMIKREEEMILEEIVHCGVRVDKEELIKALEYDRRQYDKGFRDGVIEFAENSVDQVEKARLKYQRLCKEQGEEMEEHMHIHFNGIIKIINDIKKEKVGDV